jgi:D-alanyl-D-alanine carboxypeptidase-like protein
MSFLTIHGKWATIQTRRAQQEGETMDVRTYLGKVYVIDSNEAVIRNENGGALRYKVGEVLPPGAHVGDVKMIPLHTEINVTDVKALSRTEVMLFARPAGDSAGAFGWTKAMNVRGSFLGEVTGFSPSRFEMEPDGNNKTCFDPIALIRGGPPDFDPVGGKIPQGSFVVVTETSNDKQNVKVSNLQIVNGDMVVGEEIGWTRLSNLADGCSSDQFLTPQWFDKKGPNACWRDGHPLFPKVMVNIIGVNIEMEQVTFESLAPYLKMVKAARDEANLAILINSAFRTFERQADLFKHGPHLAARPGFSNHQHGQAFDLNTGDDALEGGDPLYEWLKKNAPKHGFIRTVNREPWHWEYLPREAAQMAPGQFKLPPDIT